MPYVDFEDLPRRTVANEVYVIKHLTLLKIQNVMDISLDFLE